MADLQGRGGDRWGIQTPTFSRRRCIPDEPCSISRWQPKKFRRKTGLSGTPSQVPPRVAAEFEAIQRDRGQVFRPVQPRDRSEVADLSERREMKFHRLFGRSPACPGGVQWLRPSVWRPEAAATMPATGASRSWRARRRPARQGPRSARGRQNAGAAAPMWRRAPSLQRRATDITASQPSGEHRWRASEMRSRELHGTRVGAAARAQT
jgi:hypothetical protein